MKKAISIFFLSIPIYLFGQLDQKKIFEIIENDLRFNRHQYSKNLPLEIEIKRQKSDFGTIIMLDTTFNNNLIFKEELTFKKVNKKYDKDGKLIEWETKILGRKDYLARPIKIIPLEIGSVREPLFSDWTCCYISLGQKIEIDYNLIDTVSLNSIYKKPNLSFFNQINNKIIAVISFEDSKCAESFVIYYFDLNSNLIEKKFRKNLMTYNNPECREFLKNK